MNIQFKMLMKMHDIHINENDFDLYSMLDDTEKLEFLSDLQYEGESFSASKHISNDRPDHDIYEPLNMDHKTFKFNHKSHHVLITTKQNLVILSSNSLKSVRHVVYRFLDDGYILKKLSPKAKFQPSVYRYHRAYRICGAINPVCPN